MNGRRAAPPLRTTGGAHRQQLPHSFHHIIDANGFHAFACGLAVIEQAQVSGMPKMGVLAALADSLCYRTVSPEGYNFANEALALNAAASGSLPVFITESDIAYCDPDAAHTEQNAAILQRAVIAITKERGENAPQTKDVKRRLARFQQFWRQTKSTPSS